MRRLAGLAGLTLALVLCLGIAAQAKLNRKGDLIVSFQGEIKPSELPRSKPAPVSVRVAGNVKTTKGLRLPQLRKISVAINRSGRLFDKGLPTCQVERIQPATEEVARQRCADSIVGFGHVTLVVRLPQQPDYISRNNMLAFNGPREGGRS